MDNNIGVRVGEVIKALGMKKVRFAERIGVDQSYMTKLSKGAGQPSDLLITSICREFNVNETWLRTGEGDMFRPRTQNDLISDFMGDILNSEPDFRQQLIGVLARMTPEEWRILERKAVELTDGLQSQKKQPADSVIQQNQLTELVNNPAASMPEPPIPEGSDPEIEAELARIRAQRILERRTRMSQASTHGKAG